MYNKKENSSMRINAGREKRVGIKGPLSNIICILVKLKLSSNMDATALEIGSRVHCEGEHGTVLYIGQISGMEGENGKLLIPNAGSFIKISKADLGISCPNAIKIKYGKSDHSNKTPNFINLPQNSGTERQIEMVGMEKIMGKQSNFSQLTDVVLSGMLVNGPGNEHELKDLAPNIRNLDLSENLLASWEDVNNIVKQLSHLSTLVLSKNHLNILEGGESCQECYKSLKLLVLNSMAYSWKEVLSYAIMWPFIEELFVHDNEMLILEPPSFPIFSKLKLLSLENNPLKSWNEVNKLGSLAKVAVLNKPETIVRVNEDGTQTYLGDEGNFLQAITRGLNAELRLVYTEDISWGQLQADGNWTGMVGKLQKDLADIAVFYMGMREDRMGVVDFSPSYTTEDVIFVIKKEGYLPKSLAFIKTFDSSIWIALVVVFLLMPSIFKVLLHVKNSYNQLLLMLTSYILGQAMENRNKSLKYRVVLSSWLIFATVISFSYSAVFFSLLTLPGEIQSVRNFQELSEAVVKKNYKCYIPKGSSLLDLLLKSDKKYLNTLGQTIVTNEWYIKNGPLLFNDQIDTHSALIGGRDWLGVIAGPEIWKHNYISEESLMSYPLAVSMKKNFCLKKNLVRVIHRINNAGIYYKQKDDATFQLWSKVPEKRRNVVLEAQALSLTDLAGAFLLHLAGIILAMLCFICEIVCVRCVKRNNS
ncbi:tubulin-specific chaperone E [Caerostris darwini]|uniref:Tubulin-specific chaperone E n=1 Tax=Caerostris darwini TaxID=1538125 RepID=A0AAV4TZL5_9ARAC|nr:tubulin-specific chaperone E [Caerostris darwini]